MSAMPSVAKVSVEVALDREFDYSVPASMRGSIAVGMQVEAPFGRRTVRGYVVGLADHSDIPTLKPLRRLIGGKPLVEPSILELARWMADYYVAPVESAIRTVLPSAVRRAGAGFKEKLHVQPDAMAHDERARAALRKRSPRRADVLDRLLREREMFLGDLLAAAGTTAPTVRKLETEGFVRIGRRAELRSPTEGRTSLLPTAPLQLISMDTLDPPVVLLFGVTGSGKTEVYLQAIQHAWTRAGRDRAGAGDLPDPADRGALPRPVRRSHRRAAQPSLRAANATTSGTHPRRLRAHRHRRALRALRARGEPRPHRGRRGARAYLQAGGGPALPRPRRRRHARQDAKAPSCSGRPRPRSRVITTPCAGKYELVHAATPRRPPADAQPPHRRHARSKPAREGRASSLPRPDGRHPPGWTGASRRSCS
jgi:hypothetical protein